MLLIYTFYFKSEYSAYFWFRSFKKSLLIAIAVSTSPMTIPFALVSIVIIVFILAHTTGCHRRLFFIHDCNMERTLEEQVLIAD